MLTSRRRKERREKEVHSYRKKWRIGYGTAGLETRSSRNVSVGLHNLWKVEACFEAIYHRWQGVTDFPSRPRNWFKNLSISRHQKSQENICNYETNEIGESEEFGGYFTRLWESNAYRILLGKRPLVRRTRRYENNTHIDVTGTDCTCGRWVDVQDSVCLLTSNLSNDYTERQIIHD